MAITLLCMKTGQQCLRCDSLTTTSAWYRAKTCGFADVGYVCSRCYGYLRDRQLGIFKDVKNQRALRRCSRCDSNKSLERTTPTGYKYQQWHSVKGEWLCHKCWCRKADTTLICENCGETFLTNWINKNILRTNNKCKRCRGIKEYQKTEQVYNTTPEQKESNKRKNANRFKYRGKYIRTFKVLEKKTGYCQWCPNNIYDKTCKSTQFHHKDNIYDDNNPLWNTIELCPQCHSKETIRLSRVAKSER